MTVQERLANFHNRIASISIGEKKIKHYYHGRMDAPFLVWAEDGPGRYFNADGRRGEWTANVTIDYFTKKEYDPVFDEIQELLHEMLGSRWRWTSTDYEEGTNLIHHVWECEV